MFYILCVVAVLSGIGSIYGAVSGSIAVAVGFHFLSGISAFYSSVHQEITSLKPAVFEKAVCFFLPCTGGIFLSFYLLFSEFRSKRGGGRF